jgi:hypothetical protein
MLPCNAKLACGHTCRLRCHAYDRDHSRQQCNELVLSFCEEGHVTTHKCSDKEAPCSTCVDIRRVLDREKGELTKLVCCLSVSLLLVKASLHDISLLLHDHSLLHVAVPAGNHQTVDISAARPG